MYKQLKEVGLDHYPISFVSLLYWITKSPYIPSLGRFGFNRHVAIYFGLGVNFILLHNITLGEENDYKKLKEMHSDQQPMSFISLLLWFTKHLDLLTFIIMDRVSKKFCGSHSQSPPKCSHEIQKNPLYKGSAKNWKGERHRIEKCVNCLIWGVWGKYAKDCLHHFAPATKVDGVELDDQCLGEASNVQLGSQDFRTAEWLSELSPIAVQLKASREFHSFGVQLEPGQFGEAYHVFICRLLLGASPQINMSVKFNSGHGSTAEIEDLFHWYQIPLVDPGEDMDAPDSKGQATRVIAAAFRAANSAATDPKTWQQQLGQHTLFQHITDCLDLFAPPVAGLQRSLQMPIRYFQPSYAAKYWLNRYFRLTGQFGKKDDRGFGMVKSSDVGRLAVIHVRRSAASLIGRLMDNANLKYVAQSIAAANKACYEPFKPNDPRNESSKKPTHHYHAFVFTHVILYGDFDYHEGCNLKSLVEDELPRYKDKAVHVSFISCPWSPASSTPSRLPRKVDQLARKVDQLWAHFRNSNVDRLPVQVKILGIWTALRKRYDDRICVIGHRSGFLESAGLIGIPIFYLNNERDKIGAGHLKEGELLWDAFAVPNPEHDRLRELADVMNTFIPVEALGKDLVREKGKSEAILRVRTEFGKELAAALYVYMCCFLDTLDTNRYTAPAWTERVRMMHDTMGDDRGIGMGQDWLKQRCLHVLDSKK